MRIVGHLDIFEAILADTGIGALIEELEHR